MMQEFKRLVAVKSSYREMRASASRNYSPRHAALSRAQRPLAFRASSARL
jgi:hypothetical protein